MLIIDSWKSLIRPIKSFTRFDVLTAIFVGAASFAVSVRDVRTVSYDDAAITFRYVANIVEGNGFAYNIGDATNGVSAPLYALLLALVHFFGIPLEPAAQWIGFLSFGLIGSIAYLLTTKFAGRLSGLIAFLFLLLIPFFREQVNSGMESAFAALLGMATLLFFSRQQIALAGIFAGLSLFNKLDSVALFLAVFIVVCFLGIKKLITYCSFSLIATLPWVIFSSIYFGSAIPYSASQKLQNVFSEQTSTRSVPLDRTWILNNLSTMLGISFLLLVGLAIAIFVSFQFINKSDDYIYWPQITKLAFIATILWPLLHALMFSLLDMGAPYPWYTTVLYPPLVVLAASAIGLSSLLVSVYRGFFRIISVPLLLVALICTWFFTSQQMSTLVNTLSNGHIVSDYEDFELTRKLAGEYIGNNAKTGDVVETCYGWIAYGAVDNPVKETCPLSTRLEVGEPKWSSLAYFPDNFPSDYVPPSGWAVDKIFLPQNGGPGASVVLRKLQ